MSFASMKDSLQFLTQIQRGEMLGNSIKSTMQNAGMGVPNRLPLGELLLLVTVFCVLFRLLTLVDTPSDLMVFIGILTISVAIGQSLLFQGERPREASVAVGAVTCPLLAIAGFVFAMLGIGNILPSNAVGAWVSLTFLMVILGPVLGYFAGLFVAGWFFLFDFYRSEITGKPRRYDQLLQQHAKQTQSPSENSPIEFLWFILSFLNPYQPANPLRGAFAAFLLVLIAGGFIGHRLPFALWNVVGILVASIVAAFLTGVFQLRWYIAPLVVAIAGAGILPAIAEFDAITLMIDQVRQFDWYIKGAIFFLSLLAAGMLTAFFGWASRILKRRSLDSLRLNIPILCCLAATVFPLTLFGFLKAYRATPEEKLSAKIFANGGYIWNPPLTTSPATWRPRPKGASMVKQSNRDLPEFMQLVPGTIQYLYLDDENLADETLEYLDGRRILSLVIAKSNLTDNAFLNVTDLGASYFQLYGTQIGDRCFDRLTRMPGLQTTMQLLTLGECAIEDLSGLHRLKLLKHFTLHGRNFTGESLETNRPARSIRNARSYRTDHE